jgi:DNA-binding CsgD family transcriptional regulator/PAS domain-containing protein
MSIMAKDAINIEAYDALVSAIYDAANEPALWSEFLARLAQAFNGHGAAIRLLDPDSYYPSFSAIHGYDKTFSQEYLAHYYQTDVTIEMLEHAPEGTVHTRTEQLLDKDYQNTEYYQDFARRWHINDLLGGYFIKGQDYNARIGVHRPEGAPVFSEQDKQLMSLLIPHLQRAFHISRHIQTIKAQRESSNDALDHIPFGVVIVDGCGRPVVVNQQAEAISEEGRDFRINADSISTGSSKATQALQQLIQQAAQGQAGKAYQGGALSVERASSTQPLSIIVAPLNSVQPVLGFEGAQAAAIVFISDPAQQQSISPEILGVLYGLTQAEARLAKELALGKTLDEISDLYHLSKHTLRAQLKSIFSKTGLKRQPDLVRLILGGPASLNL